MVCRNFHPPRLAPTPNHKKGGYFQLSATPHHDLDVIQDYPITLAVPLNLGLSLYDYYENGGTPNNNRYPQLWSR